MSRALAAGVSMFSMIGGNRCVNKSQSKFFGNTEGAKMMHHYSLLLDLTRERHQRLVQQAEAERCYKQLKKNYPNRLQQIGQYLVDIIKQLKARPQSKSTMPIFGER